MSDNLKDNEWHDIGNNNRMKTVLNGKIVVVAPRDLKQSVVPLFCPWCEFPMITREDGRSYRENSCCEKCDLHFGQVDIKDQPELLKASKEWKDYMEDRRKRSKPLIKLK